jgi:hypothetical protein
LGRRGGERRERRERREERGEKGVVNLVLSIKTEPPEYRGALYIK